MSENMKRILVSIVGIPVVLGSIYLGGLYFFAVVTVISLLSQLEYYNIAEHKNVKINKILGLLAGFAVLYLFYMNREEYFLPTLLLISILFLIIGGGRDDSQPTLLDEGNVGLGVIAAPEHGGAEPVLKLGRLLVASQKRPDELSTRPEPLGDRCVDVTNLFPGQMDERKEGGNSPNRPGCKCEPSDIGQDEVANMVRQLDRIWTSQSQCPVSIDVLARRMTAAGIHARGLVQGKN